MTGSARDLGALVETAPTRPMARWLYRCVPFLAYSRGEPPSFLYTSGRPNRCNPRGVACLYLSEDQSTADREYRRQWQGTPAERQPRLVFQARVRFRHVLDLEKAETLEALGLEPADLVAPWRGRPVTRLQRIGQAVSRQSRVAAIRYPSTARKGSTAWNVAIFPEALEPPDQVEIRGDSETPLEVLP